MNLRTLSTLQLALGLSISLHAAVLMVRVVGPEPFRRVLEDTPLEVILVNARTNDKPEKALAVAQASMAGGGEAERGRATSPLPATMQVEQGDSHEQQSASELQTLQQQQNLMLARVRQQLADMPLPDPNRSGARAEQVAQEEKRRRLTNLLAEIERRINEENARPKRRYISPATREKVDAIYYDNLRRTIEDRGTANFPESNGKKLYGELTMMITVNYDGTVLTTEVVESSGNALLDRRAEMIARAAGPFGEFNQTMRKRADQIVVASRFRFTRDETLETRVTATGR